MKYIIGTRGSKLALVQSEHVKNTLKKAFPQHDFELKIIKTKGDIVIDKPLNEIGDKGLFVKEIEEQILNKSVDMGVHSMKDMPAVPANGLIFTKSWQREDPRDVLILREKKSLDELKTGAVIATGSKRRKFQLLKIRPDLKIVDIRGNVDTRIKKMHELNLDGIVLAAAGLHRLGMEHVITQYLESDMMISAPAQGILALEIREDDKTLEEMLNSLYHEGTNNQAIAERTFLDKIGGDCHVPVGAICKKVYNGVLKLDCIFGNESGTKLEKVSIVGSNPKEIAIEASNEMKRKLAGKVYLIGGGPGDPDLITVKGLKAIKNADCIIYDRLSSPKLLLEAKSKCELIYVGKESHNHTMKQEDMNKLLVKKALEYNNVVRLKGGDVYVFGRGGEEGIFLKKNNIPFEIIPGISSSMAGLCYAGIPITHRGISTGFHVVTAHDKDDKLAKIDFEAMARGNDTCVFLMGLSKLSDIVNGLLKSGKNKNTLVAVISKATTMEQNTVIGSLYEIEEKVKNSNITSPALIVVGDVVALRENLNFFEEKSLFKKNIVIPKIGENVTLLSEYLTQEGANVTEIKVGEIKNIEYKFSIDEFKNVNWIVFTSQNGIDAFFDNLYKNNLDIRSIANCRFAVIGSKTEKHLLKYGVIADLIPESYNSDSLLNKLKNVVEKDDVVLYPKAKNADNSIKTALEAYCNFREINIYDNISANLDKDYTNEVKSGDMIVFTCASNVERFFENYKKEELKEDCKIFSIGPKCNAKLEKYNILNIINSDNSTYESLVDVILKENKDK